MSRTWEQGVREAINGLLREEMDGEPFVKAWANYVQRYGKHFVLLDDQCVSVPGMSEDYHFITATETPPGWKLSYDMFPGYITMSWTETIDDFENVMFVVFSIYPKDRILALRTAEPNVVQVVGMWRSSL